MTVHLAQKWSLFNDSTKFWHFYPFESHFGAYLAIFDPPWALEIPKHLYMEPEPQINPLAGVPAQKTPLTKNSFH